MDIEKIYDILNNGGIVITPTDTVYGIMGDALNEDVIRRVYEVKRRPFTKPLLLLVSSFEMLLDYVLDITDNERELLQKFRGVTIILKKNNKISNLITSGNDTVGIRIPDDEDLIRIIERLNRPVISSSANISDEEVITSISMLDEELKSNIDYIYDGGEIISSSSTIVKFNNDKLVILREGKYCEEIKNYFNTI